MDYNGRKDNYLSRTILLFRLLFCPYVRSEGEYVSVDVGADTSVYPHTPVHHPTPAGRTVEPSNDWQPRRGAKRYLRPPHHKNDDPEGGRTMPLPVPTIRSTSSRSFPSFVIFPQVTSPSVCIRACPSLSQKTADGAPNANKTLNNAG